MTNLLRGHNVNNNNNNNTTTNNNNTDARNTTNPSTEPSNTAGSFPVIFDDDSDDGLLPPLAPRNRRIRPMVRIVYVIEIYNLKYFPSIFRLPLLKYRIFFEIILQIIIITTMLPRPLPIQIPLHQRIILIKVMQHPSQHPMKEREQVSSLKQLEEPKEFYVQVRKNCLES